VATAVTDRADLLRVEGYAAGSVDEVVDRYRKAFGGRTLVTLGGAERRDDVTTLSVDGPSTRGAVTLTPSCAGVDVRLELRPLVGS